MGHRALPRLVLVSALAAGLLTVAVRLDVRDDTGHSDRTDRLGAGQRSLRMVSAATDAVPVTDERRPHEHVIDPETGGLVSVAPAAGVLPAPSRLGPLHVDPLPPGVSPTTSIRTRALLERSARQRSARSTGSGLFTAAATAPTGTPGIPTLSSHVAPSCTGTGTDGNRVQVLYAHEAATPSRLAAVRPVLQNEVANVDDVFAVSARQTGGERRVRWVRGTTCTPAIVDVTLPNGSLGTDFYATINALAARGFARADRKYLVFADANRLCGIGTLYGDRSLTGNLNDGRYASYARVDANCWSSGHSVAAHELTHTLGGVSSAAPHGTARGHCYDESDLMCYDDGSGVAMRRACPAAQELLLDCNHDDYFSTAPPVGTWLANNWNTAGSSFLDVLTRAPDATLVASGTSARAAESVTFTATSTREVSWSWTRSVPACVLTPRTAGRAVLLCPTSVTGPVAVTATATEVGTRATRARTVSVTLLRAPAARQR